MKKTEQQNNDSATKEMAFMNATGKLEYTLMNDYMFHVVMQRNEKVLRGLIGSLLGLSQDEIVSVELKNPIIPGQAVGDKEIILDLMIILNNAPWRTRRNAPGCTARGSDSDRSASGAD